MISMIGVIARMRIIPGQEEEFENICLSLVEKVRANEPGCVLYAVNKVQGSQGDYVTVEQYVDEPALEAHRNAPYITETAPLHSRFFAEPPEIEYLNVLG